MQSYPSIGHVEIDQLIERPSLFKLKSRGTRAGRKKRELGEPPKTPQLTRHSPIRRSNAAHVMTWQRISLLNQ